MAILVVLPEHDRILCVGLIGCGLVAQSVHIPTLNYPSELFQITYLCDVSQEALAHCQGKVVGGAFPKITNDPVELCASSDVDVVFVINSDEYHADHAILALQAGKHVFVEKPLALNLKEIERIREAEEATRGKAKVMIGYMRRYAAAFEEAVKEIGGLNKIFYVRIRGKSTG